MPRVSVPETASRDEEYVSRSVSVEAIDNGYLVTEYHSKNGEYHSTKRFSAEKPDLDVDAVDEREARQPPTSSLAAAISAVRGRR
jgi:hypothetical protein